MTLEFDLTSEGSDVSTDGSSSETETDKENEDVAQYLHLSGSGISLTDIIISLAVDC